MSTSTYSLEEFGQRIKKKYPQYSGMSDTDVANKVIEKYPQYKSSIKEKPFLSSPDLTTASAHEMPHSLKDAGREGLRALSNIGAGGLALYDKVTSDPVGAVTDVFRHSVPGMALEAGLTGKTIYNTETPETAKEFIHHPLETAETVIGQLGAGELAGEGLGVARKGLKGAKEIGRKAVESAADAAPRNTRKIVEETRSTNAEGIKKAEEAKAVETKRGDIKKNIQEKSEELRGRIETARNNALKIGNEKYNTVNEALNDIHADPEFGNKAFSDAMDKIKGSDVEPTIIKNLGKRIEAGDILNYRDLQGFYSELGTELSKGTLPGDVYSAYDTLHDQIGEEMQRIADDAGQGEQLKSARAYWKRMKQTFGKVSAVRDAATKTFQDVSPEVAKEERVKNRLRLLSDYDPEIGRTADDVTSARGSLKALPKTKPGSTEFSPTKLTPEELQSRKAANVRTRAEKIRNSSNHLATVFVALDAIHAIFSENPVRLAGDVGARMLYAGGKNAFADALESPRVIEAVTKITPADVQEVMKLPEDQRSGFEQLIQQAKAKGVKLQPGIERALTGLVLGRTRSLQETRESQLPPQ
jgi:hypothetical protein